MASFRTGKVTEIVSTDPVRVRVAIPDGEIEAIGYSRMLGEIGVGDTVVVNTTGIDLDLGTGGVGFILWNLDSEGPSPLGRGHIVKMRYTPWQTEFLAVEEPESAFHEYLEDVTSIDAMPVVACGLHSQVAGAVAGVKSARPDARVGYLMTDGAALPLEFSDLVRNLEGAGLIDVTCTAGHAFGGTLEAVNVFSGLVALRAIPPGVDVAVVAMGPGVVGTDTALGFTAIEQGQILDAVTALSGRPLAALRISFHDVRDRHRGVSHHAITALGLAARERATVVVPELQDEQQRAILDQLSAHGIDRRHEIVIASGSGGIDLLLSKGLDPSSMGRRMSDAPEVFLAGAAAGAVAASLL